MLGLALAVAGAPGASAAIITLPLLPIAQAAAATPATPSVPAPANDERANAQVIHRLPAAINGTTVGATIEPGERESACGVATISSVWYSLRASSAERIALDLAAGGELDGTIDVYHAVRSQLDSVGCQQTEGHGKASLSFRASKNGLYLIRVAALASSQLANFTLEVFLPTPAVGPPGAPLPAGGVNGRVDRIQNINAAYSFTLHAGVSYLISLANETEHACVSGALYAPGTSSFGGEEEESGSGSATAANQLRRLPAVHPRPGPGRPLQLRHHPAHLLPGHPALPPAGRPGGPRRNGARADARQLRPRAWISQRAQRAGAASVPHGSHEPFQPDAQADRARLRRIQAPAAQSERRT